MKLLLKLLLWSAIALTLYLVAYFSLMEEGTALNPKTFIPEYQSISRFGSSDRKIGPLSLQIDESSWLNPIFEPLDRIFRDGPSAPLKWDTNK